MHYPAPKFETKILHPQILVSKLPELKAGAPVVFSNGCFDILHRGHVTYLAQARDLGQSLIVALNSDASVKRQGKGEERPINCLANRLALIASLEAVTWVTYFDEDTPLALIRQLQPDILVKGGDWQLTQIVGHKEVLANGGQVYSIPFIYATSTTKLVQQLRQHGN